MTLDDLVSEWETLSQFQRAKTLCEHDDLTHLELAQLIFGDERATSSRSLISRLIRAYQQASQDVRLAWEDGTVPTSWVIFNAREDEEEQKRLLARKINHERKERGGYSRPSIEKVRKTLAKIPSDTAYNRGATNALKFVLGTIEEIGAEADEQ